jgi:hypothetical protein
MMTSSASSHSSFVSRRQSMARKSPIPAQPGILLRSQAAVREHGGHRPTTDIGAF